VNKLHILNKIILWILIANVSKRSFAEKNCLRFTRVNNTSLFGSGAYPGHRGPEAKLFKEGCSGEVGTQATWKITASMKHTCITCHVCILFILLFETTRSRRYTIVIKNYTTIICQKAVWSTQFFYDHLMINTILPTLPC